MLYYLALPLLIGITIVYSIAGVIITLIDRSGRLYHKYFRQWSKIILWLLRVKVRVYGVEQIDPSCNYVYLANHSSYLDIAVLGYAIPEPFRLIFKEELTKVPIWGWALHISPHIKIKRTDARDAMGSIDRAASEIREGASVVVFPEGTRSASGELGEFKRGGFLLAARSGVPLVPVAIRGAWHLLSRHDWRVKPGNVEVFIGKPISNPGNLDRAGERELQVKVREQLAEMLGVEENQPRKIL